MMFWEDNEPRHHHGHGDQPWALVILLLVMFLLAVGDSWMPWR